MIKHYWKIQEISEESHKQFLSIKIVVIYSIL